MKILKEIDEEIVKNYDIEIEYIFENIETSEEEIMLKKEKVEITHYTDNSIRRKVLKESYIAINEIEILEEIRKEVDDCFKTLYFETNKTGGLKSVINLSLIENTWSKKKSKFIMETEYEEEILDIIFEIDSAIKNKEMLENLLLKTGSLPIEFPEIYNKEITDVFDPYSTTAKMELSNIFVFDNLELDLKFKEEEENRFLFEGKEGSNFAFIDNRKLIGEKYGFKTNRIELEIKADGEYVLDEDNLVKQIIFNLSIITKDKIKVKYIFTIIESEEE